MTLETKTSAEIAELLSGLHTRKQVAANRVEEIANEQRQLSVLAATGDADAREAISRLDEEEVSLTNEMKNLHVAIEEVGRAQRAAHDREAGERAKQRQADFDAMKDETLAEAAAIDADMTALCTRLQAWKDRARTIDGLDVLPANKRGNLASLSAINGALQESGLAPLLGIEGSSVFGKGPSLAATAERLLKPEAKPVVQAQPERPSDPQELALNLMGWGSHREAFREARKTHPNITAEFFVSQHRQVAVNRPEPKVNVAPSTAPAPRARVPGQR